MREYQCPSCETRVETLPQADGYPRHRCPKVKGNALVAFVPVKVLADA